MAGRNALTVDRRTRRALKRASRVQHRRATEELTSDATRLPSNVDAAGPSPMGWRGRGGGRTVMVDPAPEFRGSTVQVCGLWPFAAGSPPPLVGAPLGKDLLSTATVCGDPISWFLAGLIDQPSAFILGKPGKGKSSLSCRILISLMHAGVVPLIMADLKPDYVDLIAAAGGDVITISRGQGSINLLDPGPVMNLIDQMDPDRRARVLAEIRGRQADILGSVIALTRHTPLLPRETTLLGTAIRLLHDRGTPVPLVHDVLELLRSRAPELRTAALDRGSDDRYLGAIEGLEEGLMALGPDGPYGDIFCQPTSQPLRLGVPTVIDVSSISIDEDSQLLAAVQAVCWSYGSTAVSAAKAAADAGVAEDVTYFLVMDELWQMLRAWSGMVDFVDAITRLNRQRRLGQVMITHTMDDLILDTDAATRRARGFVERSAMVYMGGLADREMGNLREVFAMTDREVRMIQSWSEEAKVDPLSGRAATAPGRGCFLMKLGKAPGRPFQVMLTQAEFDVHDTNKRWNMR